MHTERSAEVHKYYLSFVSYLASKSPEKSGYSSIFMRKNSKFLNRSASRAKHSKIEVIDFLNEQYQQYGSYKYATSPMYFFIYKYLL